MKYDNIQTMKDIENQAYFWQKIDTLYLSSDFVLKSAKGTSPEEFPDLFYPCDYGYLNILRKETEQEILCFRGSDGDNINQIIICANIIDKSLEVKLLIGCSDDEQMEILRFLNSLDLQKAILVRRTDEMPSWANSEE